MGMRRHVDGNAGNGLPEVEAVVEVEPTQVVLVSLALTAVLADDHAWNRFQDLGGPVGRTDGQLRRCDRTLAAGRRHADEVFRGILDLGQIAKGSRGRDHDIRARRDEHERVGSHRDTGGERDIPAHATEVDQAESELGRTSRYVLEPVRAVQVRDRLEKILSAGGSEIDTDTWQHPASLVGHGTCNRSRALGPHRRWNQEQRERYGRSKKSIHSLIVQLPVCGNFHEEFLNSLSEHRCSARVVARTR